MIRRSYPRRVSEKRLKANGGKMFSTVPRSTKAIRQVNPTAKAKRKAGYRKMLSGKEYRSARAEAMKRAMGRCEFTSRLPYGDGYAGNWMYRCENTDGLHAHHKSYPKSRPITGADLTICCKPHHEYLESQKLGKTRMF